MSTFIYHNGQLQYSHKEFPKEPFYQCKTASDFAMWDSYRKSCESFYASLLPVVNPEVWLRLGNNNAEFIAVEEGDHWDVPDGLEVTEVESKFKILIKS